MTVRVVVLILLMLNFLKSVVRIAAESSSSSCTGTITSSMTTATRRSVCSSSIATTTTTDSSSTSIIVRRIYGTVIHRHGDRTPITPLVDEQYWTSQLVDEITLSKIATGTQIIANLNESNDAKQQDQNHDTNNNIDHPAQGRGPFGKLTKLGLYQMVALGTKLRNELMIPSSLSTTLTSTSTIDQYGRTFYPFLLDNAYTYNNNNSTNCDDVPSSKTTIQPSHLRVLSTNFQRTLQSVQGLLVGLLEDDNDSSLSSSASAEAAAVTNTKVPINVAYTDIMIPDPHPRRTIEQIQLERTLVQRQYIIDRDTELAPVATKVTNALHPILASDAHEAEFGTPQEKQLQQEQDQDEHECIEIEPLSWNQLAELTKCLRVRQKLPLSVTDTDCDIISNHAAWKWFQSWSNQRLAYLSMNPLLTQQVQYMTQFVQQRQLQQQQQQQQQQHLNDKTVETKLPCLTIYSAHDSTLIGLLCAYHLQQPSEWPEYASYLLIELLEVSSNDDNSNTSANDHFEYYVRFSLNGNVLKSNWIGYDSEPIEMIPLRTLEERIHLVGSTTPVDPVIV